MPGDAVDFLVIGFGGIDDIMHLGHAVPGTIWLKVIHVGIRDRVGLYESAQVDDGCGRAVSIDAKDGVVDASQSMRATRALLHSIEGSIDELDISHAHHLAARSWTCLT